MQTCDAIVIGGGIIGLSVAYALRREAREVLILERGEPSREATWASAGMLAALDPETPPELQQIARASAALYPEFIAELEELTGGRADLRQHGTILFHPCDDARQLSADELRRLEPSLEAPASPAFFVDEASVDPRALGEVLLGACKKADVLVHGGSEVLELLRECERVTGVRTHRSSYAAPIVVNCAGAWAGEIPPASFRTHPVKGQMLAVILRERVLEHVVRGEDVYLVPRSDGRVLIGATVERVGFDKTVEPQTIQRLHQAAANLVPPLGEAQIHEAWAGLRPGSPDKLPILGATHVPGFFAATGHYRNGILLAPITARIVVELVCGRAPQLDVSRFSPLRFADVGA